MTSLSAARMKITAWCVLADFVEVTYWSVTNAERLNRGRQSRDALDALIVLCIITRTRAHNGQQFMYCRRKSRMEFNHVRMGAEMSVNDVHAKCENCKSVRTYRKVSFRFDMSPGKRKGFYYRLECKTCGKFTQEILEVL